MSRIGCRLLQRNLVSNYLAERWLKECHSIVLVDQLCTNPINARVPRRRIDHAVVVLAVQSHAVKERWDLMEHITAQVETLSAGEKDLWRLCAYSSIAYETSPWSIEFSANSR